MTKPKNEAAKRPPKHTSQATVDQERLRRLRVQIENVLWNLHHNTQPEDIEAYTETWKQVFEHLKETAG